MPLFFRGDAEAREAKGLVYGAFCQPHCTDFLLFVFLCTNPIMSMPMPRTWLHLSGGQLASTRGLDTTIESIKASLLTPKARNGLPKSISHQNIGDGFLIAKAPWMFFYLG